MKKNKGISILLFLLAVAIGGSFLWKRKPEPKPEEPVQVQRKHAEGILKNLAVGMRMYSNRTGGGGEVLFTGDLTKIQLFVMQDAFAACTGKQPYKGFLVELTEYPPGDGFKTNFRFVAKPASGFCGESYAIDKTEEIILWNPQEQEMQK